MRARRAPARRAACRGCAGWHCSSRPCTARGRLREEEVHLRRRLGVRRDLEDDPHAVDLALLSGRCDADRSARGDPMCRAAGRPCRDRRRHGPRVRGQQRAVHVAGPPEHRVAGEHVLADRRVEEALGREDRDAPGGHVVRRRRCRGHRRSGRHGCACRSPHVPVGARRARAAGRAPHVPSRLR